MQKTKMKKSKKITIIISAVIVSILTLLFIVGSCSPAKADAYVINQDPQIYNINSEEYVDNHFLESIGLANAEYYMLDSIAGENDYGDINQIDYSFYSASGILYNEEYTKLSDARLAINWVNWFNDLFFFDNNPLLDRSDNTQILISYYVYDSDFNVSDYLEYVVITPQLLSEDIPYRFYNLSTGNLDYDLNNYIYEIELSWLQNSFESHPGDQYITINSAINDYNRLKIYSLSIGDYLINGTSAKFFDSELNSDTPSSAAFFWETNYYVFNNNLSTNFINDQSEYIFSNNFILSDPDLVLNAQISDNNLQYIDVDSESAANVYSFSNNQWTNNGFRIINFNISGDEQYYTNGSTISGANVNLNVFNNLVYLSKLTSYSYDRPAPEVPDQPGFFGTIWNAIKTFAGWIWDGIVWVWDNTFVFGYNTFNDIVDWTWNKVLNPLIQGARKVVETVINGAVNIINFITDLISSIIDGLIPSPDSPTTPIQRTFNWIILILIIAAIIAAIIFINQRRR